MLPKAYTSRLSYPTLASPRPRPLPLNSTVATPLSIYTQSSASAKQRFTSPASGKKRGGTEISSCLQKASFGESTIQGIVRSENFSPISVDINASTRLKEPSFFTTQALKSARGEITCIIVCMNMRDRVEQNAESVVRKLQSEAKEELKCGRCKQALTKLFACERAIYDKRIESSPLKMCTNYLIVLTYYISGLYDRCAKAAEQSLQYVAGSEDATSQASTYLLKIRLIWGKTLAAKGEYACAIKVLTGLMKESAGGLLEPEEKLGAGMCLGECYMATHRLKDAILTFEDAAIQPEQEQKDKPPIPVSSKIALLNTYTQLGNCYANSENPTKALACFLRSESLMDRFAVPVDPKILSKLYLNIGALLLNPACCIEAGLDKAGKAKDYISKALEIRLSYSEEVSFPVLACLEYLGKAENSAGNFQAAYDNYKNCFEVSKTLHGEIDIHTANYLTLAGCAKARLNDFAAAATTLEYALVLQQKLLGPNHPHVLSLYLQLIPLYSRLNNRPVVADLLEKFVTSVKASSPCEDGIVELVYQAGNLLLEFGQQFIQASSFFQLGLTMLKTSKGLNKPIAYRLYHSLGCTQSKISKEPGVPGLYLKSALDLAVKLFGKNGVETAQVEISLGELARNCGDKIGAKKHFAAAKGILSKRKDGVAKNC